MHMVPEKNDEDKYKHFRQGCGGGKFKDAIRNSDQRRGQDCAGKPACAAQDHNQESSDEPHPYIVL